MVKINPKLFADTIYPIGSIIIKSDNADYSNWLGFTWERTLVGRVAVGIDTTQTEFDTIGETGGSKYLQEHSHGLKWQYEGSAGSGYGTLMQNASVSADYRYFTENSGTGNAGNLQPYQVVAYWKRTA